MKKKLPFLRDCAIGAGIVLVFLVGAMIAGASQGLARSINGVALTAPFLFIPLFVSVFYDSRYLCKNYDETKEKKKEKHRCLSIVSVMLGITLITSMIVLYYGW